MNHRFYTAKAAAIAFLACVLSLTASTAGTASPLPVETFGKLPAYSQLKLSPNGSFIGYLTEYQGRKLLMIQHRSGGSQVAIPYYKNADIDWFNWASDSYLVIGYSQTQKDFAYIRSKREKYILASIRRDGQEFKVLKQSGYGVLDLLPDDPNHILAPYDGDLVRFDLATGGYKIVQKSFSGMNDWVLDRTGEVRFGKGWINDDRVLQYRSAAGHWIDAKNHAWAKADLELFAIDTDPQFGFAWGPTEKGTNGVSKVNLASGEIIQLMFAHDKVDVDDLLLEPFSGRPIGVSYTVDRRQTYYWDEAAARLQRTIDKALPATTNIIVDQIKDRRAYVIRASNDRDPGVYYFLDLDEKQMSELAIARADLDPATLAAVKPVEIAVRDGSSIPGYLTLPRGEAEGLLPAVVLPHGGPHARDTADYDYFVQALANQGYVVLQPNFRGSSGYGKAYQEAGNQEWGGLMQEDVADAAHWLIEQKIADPKRVCIMGASYGGYAALIGAALNPDLYRCAISINGVGDLAFFAGDKKYGFVNGDDWAEDMQPKKGDLEDISPKHLAGRFKAPVLIIHAKDDARVNINQAKRLVDALSGKKKDVTFIELPSGTHHLVNEDSRVRALKASAEFLNKYIGR